MKIVKRAARWLFRARIFGGGLVGLLLVLTAGELSLRLIALPDALFEDPPRNVELQDHAGRPLLTRPATEAGYAVPVVEAALPKVLCDATLAAEDKRFRDHSGVDWRATLRAAASVVRHGRFTSGGSTITQQLIKLAEPRPRIFRTKVLEALQAMRLEQVWGKERILCEYLNRLDYGNRQIGCDQAARFYFGKPVHQLGLGEAALLAGLPQRPSWLNPLHHLDRALGRRQWILDRMRINGVVSEAEVRRAKANPVKLALAPRAFNAPHFTDLALTLAGRETSPVRTTLDLETQREVRRILRNRLIGLREHNVRNGAVVVIENASGAVRALVGSPDFFSSDGGRINGAWIPRSPGSALKPFLYSLALERGWSPESVLRDEPTDFPTPSGLYRPANYDRRFMGPVRLREALANSRNVPAVGLLSELGGPEVLRRRLHELGLATITRSAEYYGPGLALGNAEVRLLELVNAYACLARLGGYRPYRLLETQPVGEVEVVGDPRAAWRIADILSDNEARAYAFGYDSPLRFGFQVACKTGTSSDFRDNWALGYTPEFTVGVWVGNADASPMRNVSGVTGAGPVLHGVFEYLHGRFGTGWFQRPPGLDPRMVRVTEAHEGESPWKILTPMDGTVFYLDGDLPQEGGVIPLRATSSARVRWRSESLDCGEEDGEAVARLAPGEHQLTATDETTGESRAIRIMVKRL